MNTPNLSGLTRMQYRVVMSLSVLVDSSQSMLAIMDRVEISSVQFSGNFVGMYKTGEAASACPSGTNSSNSLCA